MIYNITYEGQQGYKQASLKEALEAKNKKEFKCFQFRHYKKENDKWNATEIRMVVFNQNEPQFGKWN